MTSNTIRVSLRRVFIDGTVLSALFAALVIVSLYLDAGIWVDDYPPDIKAAVGDTLRAPTGILIAFGVVFFFTIFGGVVLSNRLLQRDLGGYLPFGTAFVHSFALFWFVNVVDVLIVDWLFFVTLQPNFVVLPGTEGMAGYQDYFFHFQASFLNAAPWIASLVGAAAVAAISRLGSWRTADVG